MMATPANIHQMFDLERPLRRRLLHETYGGQQQGGISTPANYPLIFLFTGDSGEQYGYSDQWLPDGTFRYTGEGQVGDMTFKRGNKAIRDHLTDGKDLYLFESTSGSFVKCLGQLAYLNHDWVPNVPDANGDPRKIIVFYLCPC